MRIDEGVRLTQRMGQRRNPAWRQHAPHDAVVADADADVDVDVGIQSSHSLAAQE
jgi:hypothetical protein